MGSVITLYFKLNRKRKKMTLAEILIVLKFLKIDAELSDIKIRPIGYNIFYVYVKNCYRFEYREYSESDWVYHTHGKRDIIVNNSTTKSSFDLEAILSFDWS